jgi:hypothetical protein
MSSVAESEAAAIPSPDFSIGVLHWPVSALARSPELEPFRQDFRAHCASKVGIDAAVCVCNRMARAFPYGRPSTEYVNPRFDPVVHMRAHFAGEPGHCLTRSAILAAELLAVGVPARVVQLLNRNLRGHTLIEVWDDTTGWTLVDPTFGVVRRSRGSSRSAWTAVTRPESGAWDRVAVVPAGAGAPLSGAGFADGAAIYPEPWLYLRVGHREAPWPYRARFVRTGNTVFALGPAQQLVTIAMLVFAAGAGGCIAFAWQSRRPSRADLPLEAACQRGREALLP